MEKPRGYKQNSKQLFLFLHGEFQEKQKSILSLGGHLFQSLIFAQFIGGHLLQTSHISVLNFPSNEIAQKVLIMVKNLSGRHQISTKMLTSGALNPLTAIPYLSEDNLFCNFSHPRTHSEQEIKFRIFLHPKIDRAISIAPVLSMGKPLRQISLLLQIQCQKAQMVAFQTITNQKQQIARGKRCYGKHNEFMK